MIILFLGYISDLFHDNHYIRQATENINLILIRQQYIITLSRLTTMMNIEYCL